jgi:uncharacterized repeat protein (TIGR02543 family)
MIDSNQTAQNQKPVLNLTKKLTVGVGRELLIPVSASDPDSNQQTTIKILKKPISASFANNQFKWTPAINDTGTIMVIFTAIDNGSPSLSITDTCLITITADFEVKHTSSFLLTVITTNGTVMRTPDLMMFDSGNTVVLKAIPATGYHFVKWSGDGNNSSDSIEVQMTDKKNLTANFEINSYQLTISSGTGGSIATPTHSPLLVNHGVTTIINAVANNGYNFSGWKVSGEATFADSTLANTSVLLTGNATITANFSKIIYVVSFISQGIVVSTQSINYGGYADKYDLKRNCHDFGGWFKDSSCTKPWNFNFDQIVSDTTLYCKWDVSQIKLSHPSWSADLNVCVNNPVDIGTDCAAKYEWFADGWGMGEYFSIDPASTTWSGQGTKTLRYNNGVAGCNVYCIVTDFAGRQVISGIWSWGTSFCQQ